MHEIVLSDADESARQSLWNRCKTWASAHQAEIGVAEMALGAGLLAWSVSSGEVLLGKHVVGSRLSDIGAAAGAAVGSIAGAGIAATLLKGLFVGGVTGLQGAVAVPALVLAGGGALILSAFGYTAGDVIGRLIEPDFIEILGTASAMTVGLALFIDGARRFIKDERILAITARFVDGAIYLTQCMGEIIASTLDELQKLAEGFKADPGVATVTSAGAAIGGGALGASLAAGSVTVLGSHSLGATALSLGIASAPVWPIVACGLIGLSVGAVAFLAAKRFLRETRVVCQTG